MLRLFIDPYSPVMMAAEGSSIHATNMPPGVALPSDGSTKLSAGVGRQETATDEGAARGRSDGTSWSETPSEPSPDDKTIISKRPPLAHLPPPVSGSPIHLGQTLVGKRLEHYELDEFVGGGGMGAVFRATDTRLGRTVAVKVLSRDQTDDETIRRFQNEAQSAARLDHPNIARVYYVGEESGWNFIVFEFIEGTNLRDLVDQRGPLELEEALHYTLQVAEALAHSSSRDVVHRDIKPSNVLVMNGGRVKLVDMGLARLHQVESSSEDLTASGVTLGTFDYISPEQARDPRSSDVRSDIYSLGCTLYYMLVGQPPFADGSPVQKLIRHSSDEPPDVRIFRPELSPRLSAILAKMLAKRPSQRYQSPAELIADIVTLAQQLGLSRVVQHAPVIIPASGSGSDWWSRTWQMMAVAAVLVAGVVLLDAYLTSRGRQDPIVLRPKNLSPALPAPDEAPSALAHADPVAETRPRASIAAEPIHAAAGAQNRGGQGNGKAVEVASHVPPQNDAASQQTTDMPAAVAANGLGSELGAPPLEAAIGIEPLEAVVAVSLSGRPTTVFDDPVIPKRVVFAGSTPAPPEPGVIYERTLGEACRRAAELRLSEVELRFNGRHLEQPFEVALQRFTLRAASGFAPTIVFQPVTGLSNKAMIRLTGGGSARLAIHGVELRMELPADPPSSGWSLLAMSSGQRLELERSVLTVKDGDATRGAVHDQVAMISVQSRKAGEGMPTMDPSSSSSSMASSATISLESSIARGAATFVRMPEETALSIYWNQGLLVTPRRLIETGGSTTEPRWYESISLKLDNVTAVCGRGLYQMKRQPGAEHHLGATATTSHCILWPGPQAALFEFVGVAEIDENDLHASGSDNFYPADVLFLPVRSGMSDDEAFREAYYNRHDSFTEVRPKLGVPWREDHTPPLHLPPHELTKHDFPVSEEADAGFDPLLLPEAASQPEPGEGGRQLFQPLDPVLADDAGSLAD